MFSPVIILTLFCMQPIDKRVVDHISRRRLDVLLIVVAPDTCRRLFKEGFADFCKRRCLLDLHFVRVEIGQSLVLDIYVRICVFDRKSRRDTCRDNSNVNPAHVIRINYSAICKRRVAPYDHIAEFCDKVVHVYAVDVTHADERCARHGLPVVCVDESGLSETEIDSVCIEVVHKPFFVLFCRCRKTIIRGFARRRIMLIVDNHY